MGDSLIDVRGSGAVILGPFVTCDGFQADRNIRVQTHIHSDHMGNFSTSLRGDVFMTPATRQLLTHQYPALEFSSNVHALEYGKRWEGDNVALELVSSNHILGAAQVKVVLQDGSAVGYSGDFSWPLDNVIKVDGLVVDATYGKPSQRKSYSQQEVQEKFCEFAVQSLRKGPLHLMADTGPAERALQLLMMQEIIGGVPVVGSRRAHWSTSVHRLYNCQLPEVLVEDTAEAAEAVQGGHYVRLWALHSREINDGLYPGTVVRLTKYGTDDEPVRDRGDGTCVVGFSNHADYEGTIEYIAQTGASVVVTDDVRGRRGDRAKYLAEAVQADLKGVKACTSSNYASRAWGA